MHLSIFYIILPFFASFLAAPTTSDSLTLTKTKSSPRSTFQEKARKHSLDEAKAFKAKHSHKLKDIWKIKETEPVPQTNSGTQATSKR